MTPISVSSRKSSCVSTFSSKLPSSTSLSIIGITSLNFFSILVESELPLTESELPLTESELPLTESELSLTESELSLTESELPLTAHAQSNATLRTKVDFPASGSPLTIILFTGFCSSLKIHRLSKHFTYSLA